MILGLFALRFSHTNLLIFYRSVNKTHQLLSTSFHSLISPLLRTLKVNYPEDQVLPDALLSLEQSKYYYAFSKFSPL